MLIECGSALPRILDGRRSAVHGSEDVRRRERRVLQKFTALYVGAILAIIIGGSLGYGLRYGFQEHSGPSRESQIEAYFMRLAKTNDSPATMESADLLYYAALQHAVKEPHDYAEHYVDALFERFPDSLCLEQARALRRYLEAADNPKGREEEVLTARIMLAIEALPLVTCTEDRRYHAGGRYGTSSYTQDANVVLRPWWTQMPASEVSSATPGSRAALWPDRSAVPQEGHCSAEAWAAWTSYSPRRALPFSPYSALVECGMQAVPYVYKHLDDPRLSNLRFPVRQFRGQGYVPTGRLCYQILCEIAGFNFHDIVNAPNGKMEHPDPFGISAPVRAYLDRWVKECAELNRFDAFCWHLNQVGREDQRFSFYLSQLQVIGTNQQTLGYLQEIYEPNDLETEVSGNRRTVRWDKTEFIPRLFDDLVQEKYTDPYVILRLLSHAGTLEQKKTVVETLKKMHDPNDYETELKLAEWMLHFFHDTSLMESVAANHKAGRFADTKRAARLLQQSARAGNPMLE